MIKEMSEIINSRVGHINELFNNLPGHEPSWWWEPVNYIEYNISYKVVGDSIEIKFDGDEDHVHVQEMPVKLFEEGTDEELLVYEKEQSSQIMKNREVESLTSLVWSLKSLSQEDREFVMGCVDEKCNVSNLVMGYVYGQ